MSNKPQRRNAAGVLRAAGLVVKQLALLLAASFLMIGCARYDVRLNNGTTFENVRKPVLNKETGEFIIKNASGKAFTVKSSKVLVIEPHESVKSRMHSESNFLN